MPCSECKGDVQVVEARILDQHPPPMLARLVGKCVDCGAPRTLDFDITAVDPGEQMAVLARAWPPPRGSPYPLAERHEPKVEAGGDVLTQVIAGRWAILGGRSGSMGDVYLCADRLHSGALCIVKLPRAPDDHDALRHEINVYIKLRWETGSRSAHILELIDVAATKVGTPWLVLDAVLPGPRGAVTVDDWLREGIVTPDLASAWISHLAVAIRHCCLLVEGFVHGDLKPDNLLIDSGWRLKLFDFGMSGDANRPARVGSALYRAPELWAGERPSPMSDVYSFGCIAYELLSGRPPFRPSESDPGALEDGHRFRRPAQFEGLPALVLACLEKQPERRPNVNELVAQFEDVTTRKDLRPSATVERDWNDAAAAYISLGQPERAAPLLNKLIGAEVGNPAVLLNLGIAASQGGLRELAEGAFKACGITLGEHCVLLTSLAAHYHRNGDLAAAAEYAERALKVSPDAFPALVTMSAILNDQGRHDEALRRLGAAKAMDSSHPALLHQLAYTCMMVGRCSKARQAFDRLSKVAATSDLLLLLRELGSIRCPRLFPRA